MSQLSQYAEGAPLHNVEAPIEDFAIQAEYGQPVQLHIETGGVVLTFTLQAEQALALGISAASGYGRAVGQ